MFSTQFPHSAMHYTLHNRFSFISFGLNEAVLILENDYKIKFLIQKKTKKQNEISKNTMQNMKLNEKWK